MSFYMYMKAAKSINHTEDLAMYNQLRQLHRDKCGGQLWAGGEPTFQEESQRTRQGSFLYVRNIRQHKTGVSCANHGLQSI